MVAFQRITSKLKLPPLGEHCKWLHNRLYTTTRNATSGLSHKSKSQCSTEMKIVSGVLLGTLVALCGYKTVVCDLGGSEKENNNNSNQTYYNFPANQKFIPTKPYPLWDSNWDYLGILQKNSREKNLQDDSFDRPKVTRHIILVRHGQYVMDDKEDEKRILTALGRVQAKETGKRLLELITSEDSLSGKIQIKALHSSDLARAKETADIIVNEIQNNSDVILYRTKPNPFLNEGTPAHAIPRGKAFKGEKVAKDHPRIEAAYRQYFHRHVHDDKDNTAGKTTNLKAVLEVDAKVKQPQQHKHEFEIIVCHGNVIRYFFMRALQLPPEAWLRLCTFNCSLTYFTIRPGGNVSCRMMGDIGHLSSNKTTFSEHHGLSW